MMLAILKLKIMIILLIVLCISKNIESRNIEELFSQLEIEDKCGQMTQLSPDVAKLDLTINEWNKIIPLNLSKLVKYITDYRIGAFVDSMGVMGIIDGEAMSISISKNMWQQIITTIHNVTRNSTRLKIPVIYGIDSLHGANYINEATLFPHQLNQAATFNVDVVREIGRITALETRAVGLPWNLSPVLDVARQATWARIYETYGECPYVNIKLGEAYIKGHQGDDNDLTKKENAATCLKHFIGYSMPYTGRDKTPSQMGENFLRDVFLPPFEAAVKAGSPTVLINCGEVDGVPSHINSYHINTILKGELKFKGFVVSDWREIKKLHSVHKVADSDEEAVRKSIMAGVDMSMVPYDTSFYEHCVNLSRKDSKFLERVDDATRRILNVKNQLGLLDDFDKIYPDPADLNKIGTKESEKFNLEAARESIILAKNENNTLPLSKNSNLRILVTGPTSNLRRVLNGGWSYSWQGNIESLYDYGREKLTVFKAISNKTNNVVFMQGSDFSNLINLQETIEVAKNCDVIVTCVGENAYSEQFGNTDSIELEESQYILVEELAKLKKIMISVYLGGRPRLINRIVNKSHAVLIAFLPGNKGGEAIADIIFGDYNPNGRLPITYPNVTSGFVHYDYKYIEIFEHYNASKYILYPFGHGLSYTRFEYFGLKLDKDFYNATKGELDISVSVSVKNSGQLSGKETIILYYNDEFATVTRPVRQVKGFTKIFLYPGETKIVEFKLNVNEHLSYIGIDNKRTFDSGYFNIYIDKLTARFGLLL